MCREWTSWNVAKVKWNCSNVLNYPWWNGQMLNWKESSFFYSIFNFKAPIFFSLELEHVDYWIEGKIFTYALVEQMLNSK